MGELLAGRFELVEPIGEGATGAVWLCVDHATARILAAKVLRQSDSASVLRFAREQSHRIRHDHVLTPVGWAAENDRVIITMPLKRGGSLRTLLADYGALPRRWVLEIAAQAAAALAAVHAAGVVHRDLKPENLLLDATGDGRPVVYLADFGAAVGPDAPRLTADGQVTGTAGYLAPEALAGAPPSAAQDLYALGAVIDEMLTGGGGDVLDGDADLRALAVQLTATDPADRPRSADAVVHRLGELGAGGAWEPGLDDVEVFEQIDLGAISGLAPRAAPVTPDREATTRLEAPPAGPQRGEPPRALAPAARATRRDPAVVAMTIGGIVLLLVAVLLLLL